MDGNSWPNLFRDLVASVAGGGVGLWGVIWFHSERNGRHPIKLTKPLIRMLALFQMLAFAVALFAAIEDYGDPLTISFLIGLPAVLVIDLVAWKILRERKIGPPS